MNSINWWKVGSIIAVVILLFCFGYFLGRKSVKVTEKVKIEYVKGDSVKVEVKVPVPYEVTSPVDTVGVIQQCVKDGVYVDLFPERIVEVEKCIAPTREDTLRILSDYIVKRKYHETLFESDTLGTCGFDAEVQYNRLRVLNYYYEPITKTVDKTETVTRHLSPFIAGGITTNTSVIGEVGLFIDESWGFSGQYQYNYKVKTHDFGLKVYKKF